MPPAEAFEDHFPYSEVAAKGSRASALLLRILSTASRVLLERARELAVGNGSERQIAVIFTQIACDLHTERMIDGLIGLRGLERYRDALMAATRRPRSLADKGTRKLYESLTDGDCPAGDSDKRIPPVAWWADWKRTRDLRDDVAHKGVDVTTAQVGQAIALAGEYLNHLDRVAAACATAGK